MPNDIREYVTNALHEIWSTTTIINTQAIYTNNPRVDTNTIEKIFKQCNKDKGEKIKIFMYYK